jgi:hypothetical protein
VALGASCYHSHLAKNGEKQWILSTFNNSLMYFRSAFANQKDCSQIVWERGFVPNFNVSIAN